MNNKEKVYDILKQLYIDTKSGITAEDVSNRLKISRSNTSNYLNKLYKEGKVQKIKSRPVYFFPIDKNSKSEHGYKDGSFSTLIGKRHSLKKVVEKAKAAILYPPYGLHSIIYGETGVGKSMLAKYMYNFSIESGVRKEGAPFVTFNCADYANNSQLLMGHIFGVEKGAYTGAESSKTGLLKGADKGVLFLDEIHRLPPEGQEMLFTFIDKGTFKQMGQSTKEISSEVLIIAATTENPESTLLDTFNRRIPMAIEMPPLRERSLVERIELIKHFIREEAKRVKKPIKMHRQIMKSLLLYECKNNIGQLQSDIRLAVANSFLNHIRDSSKILDMHLSYFNKSLKIIESNYRGKAYEVEILVPKDIDYHIFYPSGKEENFGFKEIKKDEDDDGGKAELALFREGIRSNALIEKLFMNAKFFKICQDIRAIIQNELSVPLGENKFYHMVIHINYIIENNSFKITRNKLDINEVRQKNKEEFKVALKIINIIESEFNIFLSIEDVSYIALFLAKDIEEEQKMFNHDVDVIVAMHGDSTASSMVKAVKDILGVGNIYSFDMKLNKSYIEVVEEFKEIIRSIKAKDGLLLFTDMGSLNSFDSIIKQELGIQVKTISMVTTLMVLEAVQKLNIGFSLIEVYNSIIEMMNYSVDSKTGITNKKKENIMIVGYSVSEDLGKESKKIIKDNLGTYIEGIDIVLVPNDNDQKFRMIVNKIIKDNNVIALINEYSFGIDGIEYFKRNELKCNEGINRLRTIIKINKGYNNVIEGLKSSLKFTNYSKLFEDVRDTIKIVLFRFGIKKEYDMVIGLAMHLAFMVDTLVGNIRVGQKFAPEKLEKHEKKLYIIKKEMNKLEKQYNINIDDNECYGILCILNDG
ncbi:sigma-54-dependent transcriptional regulator [Clostridium sediminicola]|uniref:sigma 54-interacting transcriptional regulator n=1 Tax=Clostridium sediminicola TaxID=3114879 RepID=UPI0031F2565F